MAQLRQIPFAFRFAFRPRSLRRHRRSERGAVAVEYALGISLVVVAMIGSIESLSDRSSDELSDRGSAIGAPDLGATDDPAPPPPPPNDPSDPDPPPPAESVVSILLSDEANRQGQIWSASVTVTALDDTSRPRESVVVGAVWSSTFPAFVPQPTQCTTNLNGTCTMTIRNLSRNTINDVTLTPTAVSGPGVIAAPLPGPLTVPQP